MYRRSGLSTAASEVALRCKSDVYACRTLPLLLLHSSPLQRRGLSREIHRLLPVPGRLFHTLYFRRCVVVSEKYCILASVSCLKLLSCGSWCRRPEVRVVRYHTYSYATNGVHRESHLVVECCSRVPQSTAVLSQRTNFVVPIQIEYIVRRPVSRTDIRSTQRNNPSILASQIESEKVKGRQGP